VRGLEGVLQNYTEGVQGHVHLRQEWGDLSPYRVVINSAEYYGAGIVASPGVGEGVKGFSPKITHPSGYNTRITVKVIAYADPQEPAYSAGELLIVFYTNGDTAKSPEGYDAHGFRIWLDNPTDSPFAQLIEFRVEQSGNRIALYVNGSKLDETYLQGTLASFSILVQSVRYAVASESTNTDAHGLIIYEVVGEYYDQWEDLFNTMTQIMFIMMFITLGVTLFTSVFKAFRRGAGE
jgi:hypothetical protein